jgi:hypothetical protein
VLVHAAADLISKVAVVAPLVQRLTAPECPRSGLYRGGQLSQQRPGLRSLG